MVSGAGVGAGAGAGTDAGVDVGGAGVNVGAVEVWFVLAGKTSMCNTEEEGKVASILRRSASLVKVACSPLTLSSTAFSRNAAVVNFTR